MTWLVLLGMAIITYFNRYVFLARGMAYQPGARIRQFLSYSSYAVLTAIWAPILIQFEPSQGLRHAGADYLLASALAAILTILRVPSIVVVLASTAVFFLLRFVLLT